MTDRIAWARKCMDKKGVEYKDKDWRQGAAKKVLHRNSNKENLLYEAILRCSPTPNYISTLPTNTTAAARIFLLQRDTGILDSGTTHLYIAPTAPHGPPNKIFPQISVGTANVHIERSSADATLPISQLEADFPTTGYIMLSFTNTVVGVGSICDTDCTVLFAKHYVRLFSPGGNPVLTGWREKEMPKLWRFALIPNKELILRQTTESKNATISEYIAYDLPRVEALVWYMHA